LIERLKYAGRVLAEQIAIIVVGLLAASSAKFFVAALSASVFETGLDNTQSLQLMGWMVNPYVAKWPLTNISHNDMGHEMTGMDIPPVVDIGHLDARRATTSICQEPFHIFMPWIILQELQKVGTIHGRISSQDLDISVLKLNCGLTTA
jgi:hypothetical protein